VTAPAKKKENYSHQEFLGFIPYKGNSWNFFAGFRCDIFPRKNFLVCARDFRSQNCPRKNFLVCAIDFRSQNRPRKKFLLAVVDAH
jgi:hypothetical protein